MLIYQATTTSDLITPDKRVQWGNTLPELRETIKRTCREVPEAVTWDAAKVSFHPTRRLMTTLLNERKLNLLDENNAQWSPVASYTAQNGDLFETRARKV